MPSQLCVHLPWLSLSGHKNFILDKRLSPELFFTAESLDAMDWKVVAGFADDLARHGLGCTIHAPFMDLNPGSVDSSIQKVTAKRVEQVLRAAGVLKAKVVVFHPGYSRLTYGSASEAWVENSIRFWKNILSLIHQSGCKAALENIFEEEPSTLKQVLDGIGDSSVGHCFDSGHFNMFAQVSIEEWFEQLGSYVVESHLHDNYGQNDEHLPVGEGIIDFVRVTRLLKEHAPDAIWTLEAHSRERLERSLLAIQPYL